MALWRLYYHFGWATKERNPIITAGIEVNLHRYIIGKADSLHCIIHAINGTEDHIHVIASIPPTLSISNFVKHIKGSSAHHVNHVLSHAAKNFAWQAGYGVFSLGRKHLDQAVVYVQNQKTHHAKGTIISSLERETNDDDMPEKWRSSDALPYPSKNKFPGSQNDSTDRHNPLGNEFSGSYNDTNKQHKSPGNEFSGS
jgi:putative transposase